MKEKLYTIPLNDAVNEGGECPFCNITKRLEQDSMDFVLGSGSSYMESNIREKTDRSGFCREHFKKMFEYGNTLGNGWILKTHYMKVRTQLKEQFGACRLEKTSVMDRLKKSGGSDNSVSMWIREKEQSCFICEQMKETYALYLDTFFYLYKNDRAFKDKILEGQGFCLTHLADLLDASRGRIPDKERAEFFKDMSALMEKNMDRVQEDINWLVEKFDYRNQNADWKNSKDAIQRGMQKLKGSFPADQPYRSAK